MFNQRFLLCLVAASLLVVLPRLTTATWSVANPNGNKTAAKTFTADGGGEDEETKTIYLFKWNGGSYGTWGVGRSQSSYSRRRILGN